MQESEIHSRLKPEIAAASKFEDPLLKLAYATKKIIPLVASVKSEGMRFAALELVADGLEGVKVQWLKTALKEHQEHRKEEMVRVLSEALQGELEEQAQEYEEKVREAQDEINQLFAPGVLERLRKDAAQIHNVKGDERALELTLLVALGAQLAPLPNGRPLGPSMLVTGEAGRGKNHIADAAVKVLPEEFYLTFEIASGQSLYYTAEENPAFLRHRFVYPNEIEGVEPLVEFLRPMLSKGTARKFVTNKDANGRNTSQEIFVEGPVTTAIPTVRNKTDEQLQTRLLVGELAEYPGRIKIHSSAISELLRPDYSGADHSRKLFLWHAGMRQLTARRRVVFPLGHSEFALDDDKISHGARLWANLLGLMCTHAWLEQRNREVVALGSGEEAIVATPEDYAVAYTIFNEVCQRTVINLSETHRKILNGLYDLEAEFPSREGFTQREIGAQGGISHQAVSKQKTFLSTSAKLIREIEHGLILVEGAEPSWWAGDKVMVGLPTPGQVRQWWEQGDPTPPPDPVDSVATVDKPSETGDKSDGYAENSVYGVRGQAVDKRGQDATLSTPVYGLSARGVDNENRLDEL